MLENEDLYGVGQAAPARGCACGQSRAASVPTASFRGETYLLDSLEPDLEIGSGIPYRPGAVGMPSGGNGGIIMIGAGVVAIGALLYFASRR